MTIPANYDLLGAIDLLFPGVVVQNNLLDAARARLVAKNDVLATSDVTGILIDTVNYDQRVAGYVPTPAAVYAATLPAALTTFTNSTVTPAITPPRPYSAYSGGLPRFPDDLGGMESPDGWSIVRNSKVVRG